MFTQFTILPKIGHLLKNSKAVLTFQETYMYTCVSVLTKNLTLCGKLAFGQHSDR